MDGCAICFENIKEVIIYTDCNHSVCIFCALKYLFIENKNTCILCTKEAYILAGQKNNLCKYKIKNKIIYADKKFYALINEILFYKKGKDDFLCTVCTAYEKKFTFENIIFKNVENLLDHKRNKLKKFLLFKNNIRIENYKLKIKREEILYDFTEEHVKCMFCNKYYYNMKELKKHMNSDHVRCTICDIPVYCKDMGELQRHVEEHFNANCSCKNKYFMHKSEALSHLKKVHNITNRVVGEKKKTVEIYEFKKQSINNFNSHNAPLTTCPVRKIETPVNAITIDRKSKDIKYYVELNSKKILPIQELVDILEELVGKAESLKTIDRFKNQLNMTEDFYKKYRHTILFPPFKVTKNKPQVKKKEVLFSSGFRHIKK